MKKILAMMLTAAMMLSMGTAVWAEEQTGSEPEEELSYEEQLKAAYDEDDIKTWYVLGGQVEELNLYKIYDVTGEVDENGVAVETPTLYPEEILEFDSTPAGTNPDTSNLTINDLTVTGNTNQKITIVLPTYTKVGVYDYTITETDGSSQAVTYSDNEIALKVLVSYDYENKTLVSEIVASEKAPEGAVTNNSKGKNDTFDNKYEVGHLSVEKKIEGNLANDEVYFKMTVEFTAEKTVASDITVVGGSAHKHSDTCEDSGCTETIVNPSVIEVEDWTNNKHTATIYLKAGDTLNFYNIPDGVTYKVVEDAQHILQEGEQFNPNSAADKQYSVVYTNQTGDIANGETDAAVVTNTKETEVATGISVDSIPYIAMLGVVAIGGTGIIVSKKRRSED